MPLTNRPIAFLDIETTGLDVRQHEVLEVAYVLRPAAVGIMQYPEREVHFSLPINPSNANPKALEINGYYDRLAFLESIQINRMEACERLEDDLTGALIVGNNVGFDLRFLGQLLGSEPWFYQPLDLKAYAAGMCGKASPVGTKFLAELAEVPLPEDAHTALADACWNRDVYNELTGNSA